MIPARPGDDLLIIQGFIFLGINHVHQTGKIGEPFLDGIQYLIYLRNIELY